MEIVQVRAGFATNSSSSHSLIYIPGGASDNAEADCDQDFGWEWFTLGSREAKARYAAQSFKNILSDAILIKHLGVAPDPDGYINHESVGLLGWVRDEEDLIKFVRLYLDNESIVITGGNDNEDRGPVPTGQSVPRYSSDNKWRDGDNFLVIYDPVTGNKTHFAKGHYKIGDVPADFPELVDLKISDYCDLGCSFCYQNSTRRGKHGDLQVIKDVISKLSHLGTFEIAIGGGEPLQYPYLEEVIHHANACGVTANFTTKDYKTLSRRGDLLHYIGGVAVSVSTAEEVHEAAKYLADLTTAERARVSFQVPVGAQTYGQFVELIEAIASSSISRITLLGYKMVGRGTASKYHSFEDRLGDIFFKQTPYRWNETRFYTAAVYPRLSVGIDTQLAQKASAFIANLPSQVVDKVVMYKEGLHSCYIDAVKKQIAPSSYCSTELYQPLIIDQIGDIFNEISSAACEESLRNHIVNGIAVSNTDPDSL